jgi:hypothetical protein
MNRLQHETSPYLLQHADNPVDWYPWGAEALARAQAEDKPILLSIGYSACHWCHVMAHESFEDPQTAAIMNRYFINIKVDREERPDLDDIYMQATQIFQRGHGGWPMTVFLTPQGRPFHAGTYYPPTPRYGMPSFIQVMEAVMDAYRNKRAEVEQSAAQVTGMLQSSVVSLPPGSMEKAFTVDLLDNAAQSLISRADRIHGGLHTGKPKFPSPMNLDFLLRYHAHSGDRGVLETVLFTLEKMARGGIYDQIGYGFHRYSVDEYWLVPHFEKMLYDNAQLARVYLHAYQLTGDEFLATICRQILEYVEREMLDESGGFYSTQDADSEGEEGKFFLWTPPEFREALLGELDDKTINALMVYWDVTPGGNFEGSNILHVEHWADDIAHEHDLSVAEMKAAIHKARDILFHVREERIKPGRDEKMLAAWNGMMLAAYAEAARVFGDEHYRRIAERNAEFILSALTMEDGRLYRSHKAGESKLNGYLEDYAGVIDGLLEVYQTTFHPHWFQEAQRLTDYALAHFQAEDGGGFYDTSDEHESLVARPRSLQDNATPSGNSLMAYNLVRMGAYTGQPEYEAAALKVFRQTLAAVQQYPSAFGVILWGLDLLIRRPVEVAIVGSEQASSEILAILQKPFRPRLITALTPDDQGETATPMLLAYRTKRNAAPTVYVCQNFVCAAPVNTAAEVEQLLAEA